MLKLADSKPLSKGRYRIRVELEPTLLHAPFIVPGRGGMFEDVELRKQVVIQFIIKARL